jgi:hypothetical protein
VQGQTLAETITIASDVAKQLLQAQKEHNSLLLLKTITDSFDYPLVVNN